MQYTSASELLIAFNQYCQQNKITYATLLNIDDDTLINVPNYVIRTATFDHNTQQLTLNPDQWANFIHDKINHLEGYPPAYEHFENQSFEELREQTTQFAYQKLIQLLQPLLTP